MNTSWTESVVEELRRLKGAGVRNFDVAWSYAVDAFPPRQMESGPPQTTIFMHLDDDQEPLMDFLYRRARAEWYGQVVDDFAGALLAPLEMF